MMRRIMILASIALLLIQGSVFGKFIHIYHIGVGHGDCTLIVASDRVHYPFTGTLSEDEKIFSVLIDTGPTKEEHVPQLWAAIEGYLRRSGATQLDYFIASHLHRDHIHAAKYLLPMIRTAGFADNLQIIDRSVYNDVSGTYMEMRKIGVRAKEFIKGTNMFSRHRVRLGDNLFPNCESLSMWCIAGNGHVLHGVDGNPPVVAGTGERGDNDLCYAWELRMDNFIYFTAGDSPGTNHEWNLEEHFVNYYRRIHGEVGTENKFHFCCFKVSHHGSETSTSRDFLTYVRPAFGVIPAGMVKFGKSDEPLPRQPVLQNLKNASCRPYYTFVPDVGDPDPANSDNWYSLPYYDPKGKVGFFRDVIVEVGYTNQEGNPRALETTPLVKMNFGTRTRSKEDLSSPSTISYTEHTCPRTH